MDTNTALQTARLLVDEWAAAFETPAPNRLDVYLTRAADLIPAVAGLRVKRLGYLAAITGLDPGAEESNLEVLYHFCAGEAVITLRLRVPKEGGALPTLSEIIPSAEPFERELSEMLGVAVTDLPSRGHLYLPDDWPENVYPLRKDFDQQALPKQN